jgi:hypothetical protein
MVADEAVGFQKPHSLPERHGGYCRGIALSRERLNLSDSWVAADPTTRGDASGHCGCPCCHAHHRAGSTRTGRSHSNRGCQQSEKLAQLPASAAHSRALSSESAANRARIRTMYTNSGRKFPQADVLIQERAFGKQIAASAMKGMSLTVGLEAFVLVTIRPARLITTNGFPPLRDPEACPKALSRYESLYLWLRTRLAWSRW